MGEKCLTAAALVVAATALISCGGGSGEGSAAASGPGGGGFEGPATGRVAHVWAVGDGSSGSAASRHVAALIARGRPELFLYLGDVYPGGSAEDFKTYDRLYGSLAKRTAPTIGNHEASHRASGYAPYWARALGHPIPNWYSFRAGGWTIISLDSEVRGTLASRQARWLRSQAANGGTCRLAFWHRPRYSAGFHGDDRAVAPLWNALSGHAALVLNGHDHDMEQLRRRNGITELVAGTGGAGNYVLRRDRRVAWGTDRAYGALKLRLSPGRASYAFVSDHGRTLRRGGVRCSS